MLLEVLGRLHTTVFPTFHFGLKNALVLINLKAMTETAKEEWRKKSYALKKLLKPNPD